MTHDFSNLSAVLSRCSEQVAEQVIAEVSAAIADAAQGQKQPSTGLTKMHFALKKAKAAQAAERRAKAAARRAAKKAAAEAAKQAKATEEAPSPSAARLGSCGEAEAGLPSTRIASPSAAEAPSPLGEGRGGAAFTPEMVKYLRRCPEQHMLAVLNSYFHLIRTGQLIYTEADHRFLDNFITLTRTLGIIDNPEPPTAAQAAAFLFDNPALPLPRAQRRALERELRKHRRHSA